MAGFNFNPLPTTNGQGLFTDASSTGLVQGTAFPDADGPSWYANLQGVIAASETLPMWGGVGVYADVPGGAGTPNFSLGPIFGRATGATGSKALAGFSVFDRANNWINWPQSPVPTGLPGMSMMTYLLGSKARLVLACDPALVDLRGGPIGAQVSWDYVNQLLVPYIGTLTISSGTYTSATGIVVLTMSAPVTFSAGDSVILSSLTGSGAYASLDGTWTTTAVSGSTVTLQATAGLGAAAITGGSLTLGSGSDVALPVTILDVQQTNCMTVEYSSGTGDTTWDYNGSAAVVQI